MITQQEDCYAAHAALSTGRTFASVGEAQAYVDSLRDEPWWTAQGYHLAVARIEVGASKSRKFAGVGWYDKAMGAGRIELTASGMDQRTALHEVAHVLASAQHGSKSHDPWWAKTYLTLVALAWSSDAYLTLQRSYDAHGVDYDAPTTKRPGVIAL